MPEFKEGDIVQLKNGGRKMTVIVLDKSAGEATCSWYEGKNPNEEIFDVVALELVMPKKAHMRIDSHARHEQVCKGMSCLAGGQRLALSEAHQ
jgi:uncharacterized protein YodC (DUF2158 family)